jgi:hypothetical protein
MRFFSIKILILCILLPPLLYLFTVIVLEGRIQDKLVRGIEEICIGDSGRTGRAPRVRRSSASASRPFTKIS